MKFRLKPKCGNHVESDSKGNPITYVSGDIVESNTDLAKKFPSKFVRVQEFEVDTKGESAPAPTIPLPEDVVTKKNPQILEKEKLEKEKLEEQYGEDVSDSFPTAKKVNLKVFEKGNWYIVLDPDDDNTILTEKKLRKSKVEDFLQEYLQDED